jgi:hypothetical protein
MQIVTVSERHGGQKSAIMAAGLYLTSFFV